MTCTGRSKDFLYDLTTPGLCDALEMHLEFSYIAAFSDSFDGFTIIMIEACMIV